MDCVDIHLGYAVCVRTVDIHLGYRLSIYTPTLDIYLGYRLCRYTLGTPTVDTHLGYAVCVLVRVTLPEESPHHVVYIWSAHKARGYIECLLSVCEESVC